MTHVVAINCGANTIRLLIAEAHRDDSGHPHLEVLYRRSEIVYLGRGVDCIDLLGPEVLERTLAVTAFYAADCVKLGVALGGDVRCFVATSVTRDARSREDPVAGVRRLLDIDPEVIGGQEGARPLFTGSFLDVGEEEDTLESRGCEPAPWLAVDLGGGPTELVPGVDEPSTAISLNIGSACITECFLAVDVTPKAEAVARAKIRGPLNEAERTVDSSAPGWLVGLAGIITTVTAHALNLRAFDPQALNGAEPSPQAVLASCGVIIHSTPEQHASWGYLAPGHRDVVAAGALVWSEAVARVVERAVTAGRPLTRVTTDLYDILDGIALLLVPESGPAEGTPM